MSGVEQSTPAACCGLGGENEALEQHIHCHGQADTGFHYSKLPSTLQLSLLLPFQHNCGVTAACHPVEEWANLPGRFFIWNAQQSPAHRKHELRSVETLREAGKGAGSPPRPPRRQDQAGFPQTAAFPAPPQVQALGNPNLGTPPLQRSASFTDKKPTPFRAASCTSSFL